MKVALIHDYLREYGGAERVLEVLHEIFPDVPVFVAYYNPKGLGKNASRFASWDIRPSWFQKFPFANERFGSRIRDRLLSPFRIFGPLMFESFDLGEFDLVISSSSATHLAKSVITKPSTLHISYIHTPPRFLYGYTTSFNYKKNLITRIGGEIINHFMRLYDFEVSQRPDILIANSKNIQERIKKFYRRDSFVIYPPIDLSEFKDVNFSGKRKYFLTLNRLVRGKGTEVAVAACSKLNLPLKVAGMGQEINNLKKIAGESIEFLGEVTDKDRIKLLSEAKALLACSEDEDFGITAVEAMAGGTPVIAARAGGYLETVIEGKTGQFYTPGFLRDFNTYVDRVSVENLVKLLEEFDEKTFKVVDLKAQAEKFSKERFKKEILELVNSKK